MKITVGNNEEIKTINEALSICKKNSVKERIEIYIKKGIYKEKIEITQDNISFIGEDKEGVILTYDDCAYDNCPTGEYDNLGTFRSYTVFVMGDNFVCENLTIENSGGDGSEVGQTVAIFSNGDLCKYINCNFISNQDTMLLGPIPVDAKGARPKGYEEDISVKRTYLQNCFIQGDIDFIFGSGTAVFEECEIFSNNKNKKVNGYVTAASTEENNPFGFVFHKCKFTSQCEKSTVYMGRPWRKHGKTVVIDCEIGEHIYPELWSKWNDTDNHLTTYYGQYHCSGNNYDVKNLVSWSYNLTKDEYDRYMNLVKHYKKIF